jgi:hypothetical protein
MNRIHFLRKLCLLVVLALFATGCQKDNIVSVDRIATSDDVNDDIAGTTFAQTVFVAFSDHGNAIVTGATDDFTVTINGNDVTIIYLGEEYMMYELNGTATDGFFKLYSGSKQGITLNGVNLTNPNGAAINVQGPTSAPNKGKRTFIVLKETNALADGTSYTDTPSTENEKAALFSEGQLVFSGTGSLAVVASGKSGIVSDDYLHFMEGTVTVNTTTAATVSGSDTLKPACLKANDYIKVTGGTLHLSSSGTGAKGISCDGYGIFRGGSVNVTVTGSNYGSSGGGGFPGGGQSSSDGVNAKGMKFDGNLSITGGSLVVKATAHEGIESKGTITISGGEVYSYSQSDDAINSAGEFTISGGYVCGHSAGNDGLDANGNCYIKGGVVYAISSSSPEVAVDANTEGGYKLYVEGGTLIAIGGLESGSSLTQGCYSASSWSQNTWYALTFGSTVYAFKTPSSGGTPLVVSGASTPTLSSGVTVSGGTSYFEGLIYQDASVSGGSSVSLSSYTGGNGGGGGPGGGGHGPF